MRLLSFPVLGGAALVSSPAWWAAFVEGTRGPDFALTRYLVSVVLCWLAFEVVAMIVGPVAASSTVESDSADQPPDDVS